MRLRLLALGFALGLAAAAMALGAALRTGRLQRPPPHAHAAAGVDWARVPTRDLEVAGLFVTARRQGVGAAMDSLTALAVRDSTSPAQAHQLAHGLGRFAVEVRGGDPAVFAECSADFSSGCYHGVMEGYLAHPRTGPAPAVERLCASLAGPGQPPYAARECAHGLGHALMGMHGGSTAAALPGCDRLQGAARVECAEGVFMEALVRSAGVAPVNAGDVAAARHRHAAARAASGCADAPAAYRAACWSYQPVALLARMHGDGARTLRACAAAPDDASRAACRRGFGKQTAGRLPARADTVAWLCASDPEAEPDCLQGAVEFHVDRAWTVAPALEFCAAVPASARGRCYAAVGGFARLMHTHPDSSAAECAPVPAPYAAECRRRAAERG